MRLRRAEVEFIWLAGGQRVTRRFWTKSGANRWTRNHAAQWIKDMATNEGWPD